MPWRTVRGRRTCRSGRPGRYAGRDQRGSGSRDQKRCRPASAFSTCSSRWRAAALRRCQADLAPGRRSAAAAGQVVRRRCHRLRRLWRARQRDGRSRGRPRELDDPRTGGRLADRTVVIANTSNMPMMAREASIYTGVASPSTTATWATTQCRCRFHVALGRSASRIRRSQRSAAHRGGLPADLAFGPCGVLRPCRCSHDAGRFGRPVTVVGAVSPPGGDLTEPVTAHTQRFVRCMWSLDRDRIRQALSRGFVVRLLLARRCLARRLACSPERSWYGHVGLAWSRCWRRRTGSVRLPSWSEPAHCPPMSG